MTVDLSGLAEVERRLVALDAAPTDRDVLRGSCPDLYHAVEVMNHIIPRGDVCMCVSAAEADALVEKSHLLRRLAGVAPEIVVGPLRLDSQYWVGAPEPLGRPSGPLTPEESAFVPVSDATKNFGTKPLRAGLFTSTGVLHTHGMWRVYLDLHHWSSLHPRPWHTHAVEPHRDVSVYEITSASEWVAFVLSHPRTVDGELRPDWGSVARRYDAVHMTFRAIVATQGLYYSTERGIVDAPFWDVESTLWLRWCFGSTRRVETVT